MQAAVVPGQLPLRQRCGETLVQDALLVLLGLRFQVLRVGRGPSEEARWWHLLGVARHYDLASACYRADRVPRCDLRGLVEDYQVEQGCVGGKILSNRQRAHQQAWSERSKGGPHLRDELSHRLMALLKLQLPLQHGEARTRLQRAFRWYRAAQPGTYETSGERGDLVVQPAEAFYPVCVLGHPEIAQHGFRVDGTGNPPACIRCLERLGGLARHNCARFNQSHQAAEPQSGSLPARSAPRYPGPEPRSAAPEFLGYLLATCQDTGSVIRRGGGKALEGE